MHRDLHKSLPNRTSGTSGSITSDCLSRFRTCARLPDDAPIELVLRCGPSGRIPVKIVARLLRSFCRPPQRWPVRRGDARRSARLADVFEYLLHAAGIVDEGTKTLRP